MDRTTVLENRIDTAVSRIRAAAGAARELNEKLDALQAARKEDMAELDALVEELKPLVEED